MTLSLLADKQLICQVWEKWEVFIQMKHMKARMLDFAVQQNRLSTIRWDSHPCYFISVLFFNVLLSMFLHSPGWTSSLIVFIPPISSITQLHQGMAGPVPAAFGHACFGRPGLRAPAADVTEQGKHDWTRSHSTEIFLTLFSQSRFRCFRCVSAHLFAQ